MYTLVLQAALLLQCLVLGVGKLCETPLVVDHNLLAARELVAATPEGFAHLVPVLHLGAHCVDDLADFHTSDLSEGLAERMAHTSLQPIGSGAGKHLVDPQHMEGVDADAEVEGVLSSGLGDMFVHDNASSFESLRRELLLLLGHEVHDERELVRVGLLGTDLKDTEL